MSTLSFAQIGEWTRRNQADIAIAVGFILVALIAFGAGRLSAPPITKNPIIIDQPIATSSVSILGSVSQPLNSPKGDSLADNLMANAKGLFVASKGGTKYHWPWCSWGERIKEANKVWFNSENEAKAAGYSPCGCITSKAPAGYQSP